MILLSLLILTAACEPDQDQVVKLSILPSSVTMYPGAETTFTVRGVTRGGDTVFVQEPVLSTVLGGAIDLGGNYRAPDSLGLFLVTARIPQAADTAIVSVVARPPAAVEVSPDSITVGLSGVASFTAVVRDDQGVALAVPVTWSASNGTVTATGRWSAPALAGSYTVRAQLGSLGDSAAVVVRPEGTPPTVLGVSRAIGSAAGGLQVAVRGRSFAEPLSVRFGSTLATVISSNDTLINVTVPAVADTGMVGIQVTTPFGSETLPNAFQYMPAATVTFVNSGFEGNSLSPFGTDVRAGGTVGIVSTNAATGTRSVRFARDTTSGTAYIQVSLAANPMLNQPNGVYVRWRMQIPTQTVVNLRGPFAQIKVHLVRLSTGSGQPAWLMMGVGSAFGGDSLRAFVDNGILNITGGRTGVAFGDGRWIELQVWNQRIAGVGHAKLWVNGRLVAQGSSTLMGNDDPLAIYRPRFGFSHSEKQAGPIEMFVDDVVVSNGFIDP